MLTMLAEPNVLILDEPTNDVDTDMLAATEDLLDSWPGTLIVVSHDRYLLERVTDQQYAILDGHLRHLPGGVDEYLRLAAEMRRAPAARPAAPSAAGGPLSGAAAAYRAEGDGRRRSPAGETGRADRGQAHRTGRARPVRPRRPGRLTPELRALEDEVAEQETRWLELSELVE